MRHILVVELDKCQVVKNPSEQRAVFYHSLDYPLCLSPDRRYQARVHLHIPTNYPLTAWSQCSIADTGPFNVVAIAGISNLPPVPLKGGLQRVDHLSITVNWNCIRNIWSQIQNAIVVFDISENGQA